MTCDDIIGDDWIPGLLIEDGPNEVVRLDPQLTISKVGTAFIGRFDGLGERDFTITCQPQGANKLRITFTRQHPGVPDTTTYDGKVVSFQPRGSVGIIKGRFRTQKFLADKTDLVINGDWETERPT